MILVYTGFMTSQKPRSSNVDSQAEGSDKSDVDIHTDAIRRTSEELFQGRVEIEIEHWGMVYRLRITSLGKLILTK